MNGASPTQQYYTQRPTKHPLSILLIVFDVILIILLVIALNYFNFLPLSKIFLGEQAKQPASPASPRGEPTDGLSNVTITRAPLKFSCPSIKEFCEKGEAIIKDQGFFGLGYKLSSGSAIFAAFDGDLTTTSSAISAEIDGKVVEAKFKTMYLDNSNLDFRATYFLRGEIIKRGKVKKGEQIAISSGKPIIIYDNNSLVFSLSQLHNLSDNPVILSREYFE